MQKLEPKKSNSSHNCLAHRLLAVKDIFPAWSPRHAWFRNIYLQVFYLRPEIVQRWLKMLTNLDDNSASFDLTKKGVVLPEAWLTWEPVRNAQSQAQPQTCRIRLHFDKILRWSMSTWQFKKFYRTGCSELAASKYKEEGPPGLYACLAQNSEQARVMRDSTVTWQRHPSAGRALSPVQSHIHLQERFSEPPELVPRKCHALPLGWQLLGRGLQAVRISIRPVFLKQICLYFCKFPRGSPRRWHYLSKYRFFFLVFSIWSLVS